MTANANAIECRRLSKRYRLGSMPPVYRTLGEGAARFARRALGARAESSGETPAEHENLRHELWAVREVSFDLGRGEALGIIGANGAGKSTLLKMLARVTRPTSGRAVVRGRVGPLLEMGAGFHPELTGRENIALSGALLGMSHREISARRDAILAFAEIQRFADTPMKRYSSGMFMRLAFSVALHLAADVLLVDEVLAVGDAVFQERCMARLETERDAGRSMLLVSHRPEIIERLCPRCLWLENGALRMDAPTREVIGAYQPEAGGSAGAAQR